MRITTNWFSTVILGVIIVSILSPMASNQESADEKSIQARVADRDFPSVFQAWNPADNLNDEDQNTTVARHDLFWHGPGYFGLVWDETPMGLAEKFTPDSILRARDIRRKLLSLNPNLILIAEIRYRDAHRSFLPEDHSWWKRDENGKPILGWEEGGYLLLDFSHPGFQAHVAERAKAATTSGVFDGVMLDWWHDDADRLALVRQVRQAIGDDSLIMVNANDRQTPETAPYVNGYFMECYRSETPEQWETIADTLLWAEKHLREPRVNCVETWFHNSRMDLNLMRAVTTLTLTHSNGYCLFSDPNPLPTPDHLHNWYPFWNRSLGQPIGDMVQRRDGAISREFDNGTAIYNPMGNAAASITFSNEVLSLATGRSSKIHSIDGGDGDIFISVLQ